jgi:hypothetical protein
MKTEDVHLVHRMWLRLRKFPGMEELHHSDIVTIALTRLSVDFSRDADEVVRALRKGEGRTTGALAPEPRTPSLDPPKTSQPSTERRQKERPDKFQGF